MSRFQQYPSLKFHGNSNTMNLNNLLLMNIQSSLYFKNRLVEMDNFAKVVDEIYYKVSHLEPWEKGSGHMNKTYKVYRGVGGSGIPSTAFCLLYKLHTLKLTHKQVVRLILHEDSPYIRGLGFLYIRFTQAPDRLWGWYKDFVSDKETLHIRADEHQLISMGNLVTMLLFQNDWLSTWIPRIPVAIMRCIRQSFSEVDTKYFSNKKDCKHRSKQF